MYRCETRKAEKPKDKWEIIKNPVVMLTAILKDPPKMENMNISTNIPKNVKIGHWEGLEKVGLLYCCTHIHLKEGNSLKALSQSLYTLHTSWTIMDHWRSWLCGSSVILSWWHIIPSKISLLALPWAASTLEKDCLDLGGIIWIILTTWGPPWW